MRDSLRESMPLTAVVEPGAEQQFRPVLDLAAALFDRMLDLERIEGVGGVSSGMDRAATKLQPIAVAASNESAAF